MQIVPPALSQELIKMIRLAATTGRSVFKKYLMDPLRDADWKAGTQLETSGHMMERLENAARNPSAVHTTGPLGKRFIARAMEEGESSVGNALLFFLGLMQNHVRVAATAEANELVRIIETPLRRFQKIQNEKAEQVFSENLESYSAEEIARAFSPVLLSDSPGRVHLQENVSRLLNQIVMASKSGDLPRCRRLISEYMIRYSDDSRYDHDSIDKIVIALENRESGFRASLYKFIAIELYYSITRNISQGKIPGTIQAIRKYAHIFQGNPESLYFYEIDKMERILYRMIESRNLWKEINRQV